MRPHAAATILLLALLLPLAAGCGSGGRDDPTEQRSTTRAEVAGGQDRPTGAVVDRAPEAEAKPDAPSLQQVVGELVMTKLEGPVATAEELEAVRRLHVGGIILFGPSVVDEPQLRALLASLDSARRSAAARAGLQPRLLVSVDQEGGPIRNVPFAPPEATQPALAAGSPAEARKVARDTGRALRDVGISMDLGPVADLAAGPNRTMAGRAFGSDPAVVAPYVRATVAGLEAGGVSAVAKHFPGFGASTANSDEAIAYVDRTRKQLLDEELVPFRAAMAAGVDAVMVSHGIHRRLGSRLPGTLDPKVATELLREELGFDGVAMTDSMNARGFRDAWGDTVPRACPVAVAAGIDLILLTGTIETARLCRERILEAVEEGRLSEARVREAAARVRELRARVAPA